MACNTIPPVFVLVAVILNFPPIVSSSARLNGHVALRKIHARTLNAAAATTATPRKPTSKSAPAGPSHALGSLRGVIAQAVAKGKLRAAAYAIELAVGQGDPDISAAAITVAFCRGMANSTAVNRAISGAYIWNQDSVVPGVAGAITKGVRLGCAEAVADALAFTFTAPFRITDARPYVAALDTLAITGQCTTIAPILKGAFQIALDQGKQDEFVESLATATLASEICSPMGLEGLLGLQD